jgi:hypothetical protein
MLNHNHIRATLVRQIITISQPRGHEGVAFARVVPRKYSNVVLDPQATYQLFRVTGVGLTKGRCTSLY